MFWDLVTPPGKAVGYKHLKWLANKKKFISKVVCFFRFLHLKDKCLAAVILDAMWGDENRCTLNPGKLTSPNFNETNKWLQ